MNAIIRDEQSFTDEPALDPAQIIIDPHHHLWDHGVVPGASAGMKPFLVQDFMQTIKASGHKVVQSVYIECSSMYRRCGVPELRCVGETEFANGMAAMAASGRYGECHIAAGIVASANLSLGDGVAPVLEAQIAAGNGRLKGIRFPVAYSDDGLFGRAADPTVKGMLLNAGFRKGVQAMQRFGLNLDVWCLHSQLGELAELADANPQLTIVLDHLGTPRKFDAHLGARAEVYAQWRSALNALAHRPNVVIKIGGLGMDVTTPMGGAGRDAAATTLVSEWRPYVEACIEAFGTHRCMFASNFPVDASTCSYGALWNTFKLTTAGYSSDEKRALFSGTAETVYRLNAI